MKLAASATSLRIITAESSHLEDLDITTHASRSRGDSSNMKLSRSASSHVLASPPPRTSSMKQALSPATDAPVEAPMRDQNGFLRSFQYFSRQDYIAFDKYYTTLSDRRAAKWDMLLRRSGGNLPVKSDKLKRYIRKGIPRHLRQSCWFRYSGGEKLLTENSGLYSMLSLREAKDRQLGYTKENNKVLEFIDVLERDLHRTFPENNLFNARSGMPKNSNGEAENKSPQSPLSPAPPIQTPHVKSLRNILVAFAYYSWPHPDESRNPPRQCSYPIGYCQSLNFVAGLILLVFFPNPNEPRQPTSSSAQTSPETHSNSSTTPAIDLSLHLDDREIEVLEEKAFWMLVAVVENLLPAEMYGASLEGAQVAQEVLWTWLLGEKGGKFGVGKVAKWVDTMEQGGDTGNGISLRKSRSRRGNRGGGGGGGGNSGMPPLSMVTTSWFMTVFINVLPIETVLRVWDSFTYQGEKVLMRVTLTLLKIHEDEVLACNDTTDAWRLIKEIPSRMIDAHKLMDICFKPRVNLLGDAGAGGGGSGSAASVLQVGGSVSRRGSEDGHGHDDSEDDGDVGGRSSVAGRAAGGLHIQNDPLRRWGSSIIGSGSTGKVSGGGKVPKRGVGSVSTKMIQHYRALALEERKK
ncbi:hypothetical protein HDU78_008784 [Chytriomyces hyalinus]|nr:hypothetical protein HDU78_008784 [Chytriomyces hyalinus]